MSCNRDAVPDFNHPVPDNAIEEIPGEEGEIPTEQQDETSIEQIFPITYIAQVIPINIEEVIKEKTTPEAIRPPTPLKDTSCNPSTSKLVAANVAEKATTKAVKRVNKRTGPYKKKAKTPRYMINGPTTRAITRTTLMLRIKDVPKRAGKRKAEAAKATAAKKRKPEATKATAAKKRKAEATKATAAKKRKAEAAKATAAKKRKAEAEAPKATAAKKRKIEGGP